MDNYTIYIWSFVVALSTTIALIRFVGKRVINSHFGKKLSEFEHNLELITEREKVIHQKHIHQYTLFSNKKHEIIPELYKKALLADFYVTHLNGGYFLPNFADNIDTIVKITRFFKDKNVETEELNEALIEFKTENTIKKLNNLYKKHTLNEANKYYNDFSRYLYLNALFLEDNTYLVADKIRCDLSKLHYYLETEIEAGDIHFIFNDKLNKLGKDIEANMSKLKSILKDEITK